MLVAGQEFSEEAIERIQRRVGNDDGSLTRTELSREVCEWLDWRGADGRVKGRVAPAEQSREVRKRVVVSRAIT